MKPWEVMRRFGSVAAVSALAFNPADKHANVVLSNSDRTATVSSSSSSYCYATSMPVKNSGQWLFEFVIDSLAGGATDSIAVGLSDAPATALGATLGTSDPGCASGFTWWVRPTSAASRFYYAGSTYDALSTATDMFTAGDIVTCTVDFSTKECKVYRNGTLIYTKTVSNIDTATYDYAPYVKIRSTGTAVGVTIATSITHPVSGFTAWG